MKIALKDNCFPVFGWINLKEEQFKKSFINNFIAKDCVIVDSYNHIDESELYSYIFFNDFEKKIVNKVFIGRAKYLGQFIELDYLYAYGFYPENEIKINCIGVDKDYGEPNSVFINQKKILDPGRKINRDRANPGITKNSKKKIKYTGNNVTK